MCWVPSSNPSMAQRLSRCVGWDARVSERVSRQLFCLVGFWWADPWADGSAGLAVAKAPDNCGEGASGKCQHRHLHKHRVYLPNPGRMRLLERFLGYRTSGTSSIMYVACRFQSATVTPMMSTRRGPTQV